MSLLLAGLNKTYGGNGLTRSMFKKGCAEDNTVCEGFFGKLKNEMFYNGNWSEISLVEFNRNLMTIFFSALKNALKCHGAI